MEEAFTNGDGTLIAWRNGRAIEDELFLSLTDDGINELIDLADRVHGEELVDEHITSASDGKMDLEADSRRRTENGYSNAARAVLGRGGAIQKAGWFKSVTWMESAARDIVGPDLPDADIEFRAVVEEIFERASNGGG